MGPFDTSWLIASVLLSTPLIYAAMGEVISERAGILNVGLEGMMLMGAFFAYLVAWKTGNVPIGVIAGIGAGLLLAALMALLSIQARANQIVVGVGLWILAIGLTGYLLGLVFPGGSATEIKTPHAIAVPLLSHIPVLGKALFDQSLFVYGAFLTLPLVWMLLYRTRFGISVRATGEVPGAVDTAGVSVAGVRWAGTLLAGGMAGLGGAFLSVGDLGLFGREMTAGRGFLAIAAVIFGRWRPLGAFTACLLFGSADALELRLQAEPTVPRQVWLAIAIAALVYVALVLRRGQSDANRRSHLAWGLGAMVVFFALFLTAPAWQAPNQLWLAFPYVLTLLALAGVVGRARTPAAWAVPYDRESI